MPKCSQCGTVWTDQQLLEGERLEHFFAPGADRTIVEPGGSKWVFTFHQTPGIKHLKQCRKCPTLLGVAMADA